MSTFFIPHQLSPNCISPLPHILSPWVNQFPRTRSAETKTHIHFCPAAAKSFDLPGFSSEQSHGFNMVSINNFAKPHPPKFPLFTGFFALSFAKLFVSASHNILWFLHILPCPLCKILCQQSDCLYMITIVQTLFIQIGLQLVSYFTHHFLLFSLYVVVYISNTLQIFFFNRR